MHGQCPAGAPQVGSISCWAGWKALCLRPHGVGHFRKRASDSRAPGRGDAVGVPSALVWGQHVIVTICHPITPLLEVAEVLVFSTFQCYFQQESLTQTLCSLRQLSLDPSGRILRYLSPKQFHSGLARCLVVHLTPTWGPCTIGQTWFT